jgi:sulfate adenylyltransferase subunit 1 (EFTu-like GTPase family)
MPWYEGPTLLHHLEHVHIASDRNLTDLRFPVQWVIRPQSHDHHDYRGYAGQLAAGVLHPGDEVVVLPAGRRTRVTAVEDHEHQLDEAFPPMSVTVRLADDLDVGRGDVLCRPDDAPTPTRELTAELCWMADAPLRAGGRYALKHTTRSVRAIVDAIEHRVDLHTLEPVPGPDQLALNDIGRVRLRTSSALVADLYARNRATGSFILIDEASNDTVGAGMIVQTAAEIDPALAGPAI